MIRNIFYDTEFLDGETTTELISIALRDLAGQEYYAIVADPELMDRAWHHQSHGEFWLRNNVMTYIPGMIDNDGVWVWDDDHPDFIHVKSREQIAAEVFSFIWAGGVHRPRLWAYFSAHDHICLSRLWGPMMNMPAGIPMRTNCLAQYAEMLGGVVKPPKPANAHDPRVDVLWDIDLFRLCFDAWAEMTGQ